MEFPRNNYELGGIFRRAQKPQISEFKGEYLVDMLTVLPSLKQFSHRKVFYIENNQTIGHNILFAKKIWGKFFLEEGICRGLDSLEAVVINYNRKDNSFISNRIRDYVRSVEINRLYIGRFNYLFMGKLCFLGYFSLSKLKYR